MAPGPPAPGDPLTPSRDEATDSCRGTSQKTTPASVPRFSCAPVKPSGNTSGLRFCQAPREILGFLGPSASDLAGDHHQPRATIPMAQLWVCSFLVLACLRQCLPISGVRLSSVCAISVQWRDHSSVHGQLAATKQRQTLCNDFQAVCVSLLSEGVMSRSRSITFVETRAPPSLQICAMAFSAGNPLLPSTPMVLHAARWWPKSVEWTVTSAGANSEGQRREARGPDKPQNPSWTGNAVKGTDAKGPLCDLTRARSSGDKRGLCGVRGPRVRARQVCRPERRTEPSVNCA